MITDRPEYYEQLVGLNTRLEAETRFLMNAIIDIQGLAGYRHLIELMLDAYMAKFPEDAVKAREIADAYTRAHSK